MTDNNRPEKIDLDGWPFRIKKPANVTKHTRVLLLLHGHLGNENVMWILTNPLPEDYIMLAPRAPVKTGQDQYSWHEIKPQWPGIETYQDLIDSLLSRVNTWLEDNQLDIEKFDLMGFSQGAAMAYAMAILYPQKVGKIAAIAGFIPKSWKEHLEQASLEGKKFFVAHGTQDNIVPLKKAQQAARWLKENNAHVTFCEADTGHKISANCFKGLGNFFR